MKNWTEDFFTDFYQDLFMNRDWGTSLNTVKRINHLFSLAQKGPMQPKKRILDQCCGVGDLVAAWRSLDFDAKGVEFQKNYVDKGLNEYPTLSKKELVQADACDVDFGQKFDYAVNWNSSFGFFDPEKNYKMLTNVHQHLEQNGLFLMEVFNYIFWIRSFKEIMEFTKNLNGEIVHIRRRSKIDILNMKMLQDWDFSFQEKTYQYKTQVHAYMPHEITDLLKKIGFKIVDVLDQNGKPFDLYSERLLIIAQKV